ncbi:MAG: hypothetical protein JJU37_10175 [Balneolaceae bacterium]|nr:hypothetical protein [Balneolaceae bacterium]
MEQIIENITKNLTSKLPENKEYFTTADLFEAGYPQFLVNWMQAEAWDYAKESVSLMSSDWINLNSEKAKRARQEYLEQLKSELTIPAAHTVALTQNGVEICLDLAVNPRKAIPEFIFKNDDELDLQELRDRTGRITVNTHLAIALERYVIKKDKLTLTFDKAKSVIEAIDEKLTSAHNPLKWVDELKPVFALSGQVVDSDLIRQFFEDKGMHNVARKFDLMSDSVSDVKIIEVMSSADLLLDETEIIEEQPTLFPPDEESAPEAESLVETISDETEMEEEEPSINKLFSAGEEETDEEETDEEELFDESLDDSVAEEIDETPAEPIYSEGEIEELEYEREQNDEDDTEDLDEEFPFSLEDEDPVMEEDTAESEEKPELSLADNFITADAEEDEDGFEQTEEIEEEIIDKTIPDETTEREQKSEVIEEDIEPVEESGSVKNEEPSLAEIFYEEDDAEAEEPEDETEPETIPFLLDRETEDEDDEPLTDEDSLAAKFGSSDDDEEEEESDDTPPFILDEESEEDEADVDYNDVPLLSKFTLDDDSDDSEEEGFTIKPKTIYDELNLSRKESEPGTTKSLFDIDDAEEVDYPEENRENISELSAESEPDENSDSDEVPMWKSFLERSDIDHEPGFVFDEQPVQIDEDIYPEETGFDLEEPIFDLTKEEPELSEKIEDISGWLNDDSSRFVDEIFGGSESAYEEALGKIIDFETWKEASRFIEKEIFTRNMIDVYDEVAVDFTDRLHSYFTENKT